jgi:phosphatidylinositol kinase/protein kinase (PI-3  family)
MMMGRMTPLGIRTYAVVPLSETCGIIEWVPNTIPLWHILQERYKIHGVHIDPGEIAKALGVNPKRKKVVLEEEILPK